jgi:chaperonin GroEL
MEAVYDKPAILITDKKISSVQEFLPILEKLAAAGKKDVVLIADEVEGEALGVLILNRLKGVFNTVAVKAPSFGDRRKDVLQDIAILTGATVITEDQGLSFENVGLEVLGSARKVIVGKDNTTIIEGAGDKRNVAERVKQILAQADIATSEYDKEQLEKRAASLNGKVAVIKVGGATETEINEKKYRVDDAVAATKAALEEGIVPGGGVSLIALTKEITGKDAGAEILRVALAQPFKQLMNNAGLNTEALFAEVSAAKAGHGVNVMTPEKGVIDLKAAGVVDPARVLREEIQNSVSIAATAMTMGALVAAVPDPKTAAPDMGGGMGMM